MSKPVQAINRYKADLREFRFLLFEQFKLARAARQGAVRSLGRGRGDDVARGGYRWVRGPRPAQRDRRPEGCRLEDGQVITPAGLQGGVEEPLRGGLEDARGRPPSTAAAGSPRSLQMLVEEMLAGSNTAFNMYPGSRIGAAEVIDVVRHPGAAEALLPAMFDGKWAGTMCLTEPQAGTDVGARARPRRSTPTAATTSAAPRSSSPAATTTSPRTSSTWCSPASTARPPAPRASRSSSCRSSATARTAARRLERRHRRHHRAQDGHQRLVRPASSTSARTAAASASSSAASREPGHAADVPADERRAHRRRHPGPRRRLDRVPQRARVREGPQAGRRTSRSGRTRPRPRVAIIEHADVRRMLLDMKARVEGIRALVVKLAHHDDAVQRAPAARTTPRPPTTRARSTCSCRWSRPTAPTRRFRVCETAIQTYGGAGYTQGLPRRAVLPRREDLQHLRGHQPHPGDGSRRPQAGQRGGANLQAFLGDVGAVRRRSTTSTRRSAPR